MLHRSISRTLMDRTTVVIRKYENRRLYDTAGSRYVNLEDVAKLVREGFDVRVVDAATGEDITRVILGRIIQECARAPGSPFPLDMMRQMVMISGRVSREGIARYLRTMFDNYQNARRAFASPPNLLDFLAALAPGAPAAEPRATAANDEVGELRRRIEELENLVARSGAARPRKLKKTARP